jgi:multiple antibiotic resistance protein
MGSHVLEIFITLFAVIDPPGIIPPFLSLTSRMSEDQKNIIAARSVFISAIVLVSFTFLGDKILDWLKISESAFYIAGGLLLFRAAFNMVLAHPTGGIDSTTKEEDKEAASKHEISVFPLAIPLIAGPGSIATVILLSRKADSSLTQNFIILTVVIAVLAITYICLRLSNPITKLLGVTGTNVIGRIFGIILAALSVQFILNGISLFLKI